MNHTLALAEHVLVNAVFVVSLLFTPVTSFYWPWWKSWWGRNIVLLEICIAGTLTSSILFLDFHVDPFAIQVIGTVFLALVGVIITWRIFMIMTTQRHGSHDDS